jgi:hypothetical protein
VLTPKVNNLPNRKPRVAQRQQGQGIGNIWKANTMNNMQMMPWWGYL